MSNLGNNKDRLREILGVLSRHKIVKGMTPEKLRLIIEDLGPTFVKLGQVMSMRSDMLPEAYCKELTKLRAEVKPMTMDEVRHVIREEYDCEIESLCLEFREKPLGSASIAQAHYAVLKDGSPVVFKIQRPNIRDIMSRDIILLRKASAMLKIAIKNGSVLDFNEILDEMWNVSQEEMDFLIEAKNAKEFYKLNKDIVYATCPKIYTKYTTSKVLVMEYIDGVQIDKTNELINLGYDLTDIANKLCENYIKQIVDDAFFHADPHPGNIKIKGGEIVWIDLGMVGKLSNRDRGLIKNAIMAVATNDIGKLKDVVLTLGEVNGRINHSKLYEDIDIFMNKYSEVEMSDIDLGIILEEFLSIANRHNIGIPKGITMLGRGLITIQGVVSILAPQINIIDIVSNHVASEVFKEFDLEKEVRNGGRTAYASATKLIKLPQQLSEVLKITSKGHLKLNLDFADAEEPLGLIDKMVNKLVMGIIITGLLISSSLICTTGMTPKLFDIPALGVLGFMIALVLGLILLYSLFKSIKSYK